MQEELFIYYILFLQFPAVAIVFYYMGYQKVKINVFSILGYIKLTAVVIS